MFISASHYKQMVKCQSLVIANKVNILIRKNGNGSLLHEGTLLHEDTFTRGNTFARASLLHEGTLLHGITFARASL